MSLASGVFSLANGLLILLALALLIINLWIVASPETSGMVEWFDTDDGISILLRKDMYHAVGVTGSLLMLLILYMQLYTRQPRLAALFLSLYTLGNMLVFGVSMATIVVFLLPTMCLLAVVAIHIPPSSDPEEQGLPSDPPLRELAKRYKLPHRDMEDDTNTTTTCSSCAGKIAISIYCVAIAVQLFVVGSCALDPLGSFYVDSYDDEMPEPQSARMVEAQAQGVFGILIGLALAVLGPTLFTYSLVVLGYVAVIAQGRLLYNELVQISYASQDLLDDWMTGWYIFVGLLVLETIGWTLFVISSKGREAMNGTCEERQPLVAVKTTNYNRDGVSTE